MPINRLSPVWTNRRTYDDVRPGVFACLFVLVFGLIFFYSLNAQAQDRVLNAATLTNATGSLALTPYAIIQYDPEGKVTPESIVESGGTVLNGKHSKSDMISLGYGGEPVWVIIKLFNTGKTEDWVMDLGRRSEGRLGYILSASAYEMKFIDGKIAVESIPALSDTGVYKINIPQNGEKYILLNVKADAGKIAMLPLKLFKEGLYLNHVESRTSVYALFSLAMKAFAIFFAALSVARREKSLMVYCGYFAFLAFAWMVHENLGAVVGPSLLNLAIPCLLLGFTLFLIAMTKVFFEIEYGSFTEKYILYGLAWLTVISTFLALLLPSSGGLAQISLLYGAPLITISILSLMAMAQSRLGQRDFSIYFIGSLFPLAGISVVIAGIFGFVPHDIFTNNALWYSTIPQGLFMIWAVQKKLAMRESTATTTKSNNASSDVLNLSRLKETKETADHSRLLRVIEKEREILAELRAKETERVEEMRHAKEEADEANRAKSAFLAVVSHEIRTPMTGVMGMVRLLLDSSITKQQRDYVLTIQESSEAMLALLNDILDFERIQRGKIELEDISFDLHRLIQSVVTLMSGHAAEKTIGLLARMDDDLPKFVKGDPTRLRQVLLNLMGNAIKFTETGNVTLLVKNMEQSEQNAPANQSGKYMIYFAVQDTGIGIPDESKKNLFTPFAQANSSIVRKFGGTGLGLAISKGLIETMGSAININSKEGEGSTFFFTLEMARGLANNNEPVRRPVAEEISERPSVPLNILIVDDNTITRKVMVGFLEPGQHDILTCSTAEDALRKIDQNAFDVVFMDIELPGMKGNEATRLLRDHRDPVKSQIPVIAMTGNIAKEDMERYLADGMSGFLPKPIDMDKVNSIVNEIAHKSFEREIRMPGNDPFMQSQHDFEQNTGLELVSEAMPHDASVFNPDMLQSLKDTIGASQLNELLTDLIIKTEEILMAMDMATKIGDLDALAARAHELKGMAGNFGLVEISGIAAQAERKAKSSEMSGIAALVDTLPAASERAQLVLKDWIAH